MNTLHKPGDFPVGSLESRAAARMLLIHGRKRLRIIWSIPPRGADISRIYFGAWQQWPDGMMGQQVYLPHVWVKPEEAVPTCPDCGTPFRKTREYPGMVGFLADCMDRHDATPQFDLRLNS